jgi:hypothetical protein
MMTFLRRRMRREHERGATLIIVALAIPAVVGFAGLAVDGSRAYDERRQMQNAADASALAGTRKFNDWLMNPESVNVADVNTVVREVAVENGADPAQLQCNWIAKGDPTLVSAELGPCSDTGQASLASGVRVRTASTQDTFFIRSQGADDFTAGAKATAQVQRLIRFGQGVPFLICSQYDAIPGEEQAAADLLDQDAAGVWSIKPEAFGQTINLHGSQMNDCGLQGNNFKGVAEVGENDGASIPGNWVPDPGTQAGPVRQDLGGMGGCNATNDLEGCVLLLPICPSSNGGNLNNGGGDGRLYCTQMGLFQIHQTGANEHTGTLIQGTIILPDGIGGDLPVGQNEARVVRLVD